MSATGFSGMLTQGALEAAEQLINPLLQRDAAAILKLAPLTGKVIRVRCTVSGMTRSDITGSDIIVPDITVLIWPSAQGLHFERDSSPEPAPAEASIPPIAADAEIEGSFENFARFMLAGERREALLFAGALTLRGDTALVRKLQQITGDLDLDLSALGDQWLGVVPSALLSKQASGFMGWKRAVMRSGALDLQEYLQEELALLPAKAAQQGFTEAVLDTRRTVDRLEARLQRLEQLLRQHTPSQSQQASPTGAQAVTSDAPPSSESHL